MKKEERAKILRLQEAARVDRDMSYRMSAMNSNFYGLKHLMPLIETLAYISMDCAWPKQKDSK